MNGTIAWKRRIRNSATASRAWRRAQPASRLQQPNEERRMRASKSRWVLRALVRPVLCFCACSLLAAVLAAQCTNPIAVPNGTYTSGDHSQVDNNALSASNFAVSGGATATFAAGNCIHLAPGFRANATGA